jgi:hypothetical protein
MHRKRDYYAANIGWLWKQRHVYTGGESDSTFTGTKEINRFGDSRAIGFVTDRYRFRWMVMTRFNLPIARWIAYTSRVPANSNGTDTTLLTPALTITAHTSLGLASSIRNNTFGFGATIADQTAQLHGGHDLAFHSLVGNVETALNLSEEAIVARV